MKSKRIIGELLLLAVAVIVLWRMLRGPSQKASSPMAISDATSPACETAARQYSCGALVLHMLPSEKSNSSLLKLNDEDLRWDQAESMLGDVLRTRADRTVFLRSDPSLPLAMKSRIIDVIRKANAERVCLIDFKNPPAWYPQRCGPAASLVTHQRNGVSR